MSIGIIGAGALGANLAKLFAQSGVSAVIANSRGPETLTGLVDAIGASITAGTFEEAASADMVVIAVRWVDVARALEPVSNWENRVLVDATNAIEYLVPGSPETKDTANPLAQYGIRVASLDGRHSSQIVQDLAPGARVVKAFNHYDVTTLQQPRLPGGQRVLFYSGDDAAAKSDVRKVIETTGFFPVDLGTLNVGGPLASVPAGSLAAATFLKA